MQCGFLLWTFLFAVLQPIFVIYENMFLKLQAVTSGVATTDGGKVPTCFVFNCVCFVFSVLPILIWMGFERAVEGGRFADTHEDVLNVPTGTRTTHHAT